MKKRAALIPWLLVLLICCGALAALNCGYSRIPYPEVLKSLVHPGASAYSLVIMRIRLPRIALSVLCGMGLALSGCTLQALTENPLADPGILGINAGAGFMVMILNAFFPSLHLNSRLYVPVFALAGALAAAALVYGFSRRNGKLRPGYLLLGGIGTSAGFSALMLVIGADMKNNSFQSVARWMAGNIWGSGWYQVSTLFPWLLVLAPLLFLRADSIDILALGEEAARALGLKVERERRLLLVIASGCAASCISVSGGIGFVGLVSPHIAGKLVGPRHKRLLAASMLVGGLLLLAADTAGRSLFQPLEIPAGIVVSVLAAPYFLYLLRRQV
ncbi:MAG: iron ABC transporter permease [Treponema sp.]|nr:iron ABC transporter permease [Treponema sp.]